MPGMQRTSVATMSRSFGSAVTRRSTRSRRISRATVANSPEAGRTDITMIPKSKRFQPSVK
jgi:hypothetical protein